MKTYTIQEIKDKGIWVKCTGEDATKLLTKMGCILTYSQCCNFYRYEESNSDKYRVLLDSQPDSFITFDQIDWEDKKIIEYRVEKECWGINGYHFFKDGVVIVGSPNFYYFTETGLINNRDYFTPIYEEKPKYKVGDWVKVSKNAGGWGSASGNVSEKIKQISTIIEEPRYTIVHFTDDERTELKCIERHATPSEIAEAEKITIGGYDVKFYGKIAAINEVYYGIEDLKTLVVLMELGQIKSLNVGCQGQFKVDQQTIEKIISKM